MDFKSEYFDVWGLVWNFHKKYAGTPTNWEQAVEESAVIIDSYKDKPHEVFLKTLLVAVMKELERREKDGQ